MIKSDLESITNLETQYYKETEEFESTKDRKSYISYDLDIKDSYKELFKEQTNIKKENNYDLLKVKDCNIHILLWV